MSISICHRKLWACSTCKQTTHSIHLQTCMQKHRVPSTHTYAHSFTHASLHRHKAAQTQHVDSTRNLSTQRVLWLSSSSNLFKQTKIKKYHYYVFTDKLGAFLKKCIYLNVINCFILANLQIPAMFSKKSFTILHLVS